MPPLPPPPDLADGVVRLRPWTPGDAPDVADACRDPEIPRWTRVPDPYTDEDARSFVADADPAWREGRAAALAVVDDRTGELLGSIALVHIEERRQAAEIGYWVKREARGRGVATRAVRLLSRWALTEAGVERLELFTHVGNVHSQRVAERAGYTNEGVLRSYEEVKDRRVDVVSYSLLRSDLPEGMVE